MAILQKKCFKIIIQVNIYNFLDREFIHYSFIHYGDAADFFAMRGHFILAHRKGL